jgi:hypothetical protein
MLKAAILVVIVVVVAYLVYRFVLKGRGRL